MKKLGLLICAFMVMAMLGCNTKSNVTPAPSVNQGTAQSNTAASPSPSPSPSPSVSPGTAQHTTTAGYKDGTYTALDDKWKYGQESATITIKKGKMIYILLKRLDTTGKQVNYNDWTGKKQANGQIKPNLKKFRLDMAKRMLTNQTYQVDTISTATVSTGGWKVAVQRALEKAKK